MTKEEAITKLENLGHDVEIAHSEADAVLIDFLFANGFEDVAEAWIEASDQIGFWYS